MAYYLSLEDHKITILLTKKSLFSKEKIIATSRKELPPGIFKDGLIAQPQQLIVILAEIIGSLSAKSGGKEAVFLVLPNKHLIIHRLEVPVGTKNEKILSSIRDLHNQKEKADITCYEGVYKISKKTQTSQEILYFGLPLSDIYNYYELFNKSAMPVKFVTASCLVLHRMLKDLLKDNGKILYCDIDKTGTQYILYDKLGPLEILEKKHPIKTFVSDLPQVFKHFQEEEKHSITQLVYGGEGSLEINQSDLDTACPIRSRNIGEIIDELIQKMKIDVDTGAMIRQIYADPLGLFILAKDVQVPNFAISAKDMPEKQPADMTEETEKKTVLPEKKEEKQVQNETLSAGQFFAEEKINAPLTTSSNNLLNKIMQKKKFMLIPFVLILLIIGLIVSQKITNLKNLSFLSASQPSPTPTVIPSPTPTPTIDPALKRNEVDITVQNGTSVTGYAKEIALLLEKKGYKNVGKENSDRDDYENTIIKIKENKKKYLPLILSDLVEKITITVTEDLPIDASKDVIIILGKK